MLQSPVQSECSQLGDGLLYFFGIESWGYGSGGRIPCSLNKPAAWHKTQVAQSRESEVQGFLQLRLAWHRINNKWRKRKKKKRRKRKSTLWILDSCLLWDRVFLRIPDWFSAWVPPPSPLSAGIVCVSYCAGPCGSECLNLTSWSTGSCWLPLKHSGVHGVNRNQAVFLVL